MITSHFMISVLIGMGIKMSIEEIEMEKNKSIEELKLFKHAQEISDLSVWWIYLDDGLEFYYHTDEGVIEFGIPVQEDKRYKMKQYVHMMNNAINQHPEYKDMVEESNRLFKLCTNGDINEYEVIYPIIDYFDNFRWIKSKGRIIKYHEDGTPLVFIGVDIDVSGEVSQKKYENRKIIDDALAYSKIGTFWRSSDRKEDSFISRYLYGFSISGDLDIPKERERLQKRVIHHHPEYKQYFDAADKLHLQLNEGLMDYAKYEIPVVTVEGELRWLENRVTVVSRDSNYLAETTTGAVIDITKQKNYELNEVKLKKELTDLKNAYEKALYVGEVMYFKLTFDKLWNLQTVEMNDLLIETLQLDKSLNDIELWNQYMSTYRNEKVNNNDVFFELLEQLKNELIAEVVKETVVHLTKETESKKYLEQTIKVTEKNDKQTVVVGFLLDVTEKKENQILLQKLAEKDQLTNVYNRNYFEDFIASNRMPESFTFIIADVDGLKLVNDTLGHIRGDELIIKSSDLIKDLFKENILIARIGGDEFTIITSLTDEEEINIRLDKLRKSMKSVLGISWVETGISLGYEIVSNWF